MGNALHWYETRQCEWVREMVCLILLHHLSRGRWSICMTVKTCLNMCLTFKNVLCNVGILENKNNKHNFVNRFLWLDEKDNANIVIKFLPQKFKSIKLKKYKSSYERTINIFLCLHFYEAKIEQFYNRFLQTLNWLKTINDRHQSLSNIIHWK